MSKPVVFIIGASGKVGTATVKALSAKHADKVEIRAGVRNPDKADQLKSLAGVSVVKAEMSSSELDTTLKGVSTLFIVTPPTENCAELVLSTAQAAKRAGVGHLLTIIPPRGLPEGSIFLKLYGTLEDDIRALGVGCTFFNLPYFYENYFAFAATVKASSAIHYPVDPTKPYSSMAVCDAGNMAATILVNPTNHAGKTYAVSSDVHNYGDLCKSLGEALNKTVTYHRIPYDELEKTMLGYGMPKWQVQGLIGALKQIDEGHPIMILPRTDYEMVTGEQPTSLKTWISQMKSAFE